MGWPFRKKAHSSGLVVPQVSSADLTEEVAGLREPLLVL